MDPIDELPASEESERSETTDQEAAAEARASLTTGATSVFHRASAFASGSNSSAICSDHLLLALAETETCSASGVLIEAGLGSNVLTTRHAFVVGSSHATSATQATPDLPLSPRVERILASALRDARKRSHQPVSSLHLLAALIRLREGVGIALLEQPGVGIEPIARAVATAIATGTTDPS